MTTRIYSNNFSTILDGAIGSGDLTITLSSVTGLPTIVGDQEFRLTLGTGSTVEVVIVTAVVGFDLTVTRGEEGTAAAAWADASDVSLNATDDSFERLAESHIAYRATSTGVLSGGVVTINADTAKFDMTAGTGIIVDSHTDPDNPVITEVSWSAATAQTTTYLATNLASTLAIDDTGAIVQVAGGVTNVDFRDTISLATLVHPDNVAIQSVGVDVVPAYDPLLTVKDLSDSIGPINVSGNTISGNGSNLSINKSAGNTYILGNNFYTSTKDPHVMANASLTAPTMFLSYRDGSGGLATPNVQTTLDPGFYDDGTGTLASVGNNEWTILRVFMFSSTNNILVAYGQNIHTSQAGAEASINTESFDKNELLNGGSLRSYIVIKGNATDITNSAQATLINGGKFGDTSGGGSGSSTTTLQQAYDNSTDPEIDTDATRGAFSVQRGSALDSDTIYEGLNGAGTVTFSVTGDGDTTLVDLTATGVVDAGGATSLEIPNGATPTVDAAGEVAVDTTITDHTGLITYHDGTEALYAVGLPTANLLSTDGYVIAYNATNNEFEMVAGGGGGGSSTFAGLTDITFSTTTATDDTASYDDVRYFRTGNPLVTNGGVTLLGGLSTSVRMLGWGGHVTFPTPRLIGNAADDVIGFDASHNPIIYNSSTGLTFLSTYITVDGTMRFGSTDYLQNNLGRTVLEIGQTNSASTHVKIDCGTNAKITPSGTGELDFANGFVLGGGTDVLEDYEIGTFTATLDFATTGDLSVVYSNQAGTYTRIGNLIIAKINMSATPTFTTASGEVEIGGLPFAAASTGFGGVLQSKSSAWTFPTGTSVVFPRVASGDAHYTVRGVGSTTGLIAVVAADCTSASAHTFSGNIYYYV